MQDIHIHVTHHNFPARRKQCPNTTCIFYTFAVDFHIDNLEIGLHTAEITELVVGALPTNKQFQN
jgi:hypothetical protein